MMDYETVDAAEFGCSLRGIGINLLSPDVEKLVALLVNAFGAEAFRVSKDFAILRFDGTLMQIHHDATYRAHPLLGLVPENPPRGAGAQFYLFGVDPDKATSASAAFGGTVIEPPKDKPHGLYEGTVLSAEGYAFTAAVPTRKG